LVKSVLCSFALLFSFAAALDLGARTSSAADDCITESDLVPPKGSHWEYRIDHATNRKCWHIVASKITSVELRAGHTSARKEIAQSARPNRHELSESDQAALFLEFLRWKEQQSAANGRVLEPSP
jgi:hypothetical protein